MFFKFIRNINLMTYKKLEVDVILKSTRKQVYFK